MIMENFADRLLHEIDEKGAPICIGLDPVVSKIPRHFRIDVLNEHDYVLGSALSRDDALEATADLFVRFNKVIIDATHDLTPVFKPQSAHYERLGHHGVRALGETIRYIKERGCIALLDAKRQDIGKTARAYADAYLGETELIDGSRTPAFVVDAITVGPYLGSDSVREFAAACEKFKKGAFVLVKTSNKSSCELQNLPVEDEKDTHNSLYNHVAELVDEWGRPLIGYRGFSSLGSVVGATYPEEASLCRVLMPYAIFLVPGYGSQGATALDVMPNFKQSGYGAIINNSSGINFAYQRQPYEGRFGRDFAGAARQATIDMREDILTAMKATERLPERW